MVNILSTVGTENTYRRCDVGQEMCHNYPFCFMLSWVCVVARDLVAFLNVKLPLRRKES